MNRNFLTLKDTKFWDNDGSDDFQMSGGRVRKKPNIPMNVKTNPFQGDCGGFNSPTIAPKRNDVDPLFRSIKKEKKRPLNKEGNPFQSVKEERPNPFEAAGRNEINPFSNATQRKEKSSHGENQCQKFNDDFKPFEMIKQEDDPFERSNRNEAQPFTPNVGFRSRSQPHPRSSMDPFDEEQLAPYLSPFHSSERKVSPEVAKLVKRVESAYEVMKELRVEDNVHECKSNRHSVCNCYRKKWYQQINPFEEIFSRKVFVGGLSPDLKGSEAVEQFFGKFGFVKVDWPRRNETTKGYAFLIYAEEVSVRHLVEECENENDEDQLFLRFDNYGKEEKIQVRPWRLADADYLVDPDIPVNAKYTLFVGGVPRPLRAAELAHLMERLYGTVIVAGIDIDVDFKYPKGTGAGRVVFENEESYRKALEDRFAYLGNGEVQRRVEMKPYVLDDMTCEECREEYAPFFCPSLDCLQYYCEVCWMKMHSVEKRERHTPLLKDA